MKIAAIYARVSSDQQKEENTIASQTAALVEFAREQGFSVPDEWVIEDEGFSGASLLRPGLERLRDLAAEGQIQAILIHSPDRLSRKYAYQVLLTEEFARHGVETIFIKAPHVGTPEDQLMRRPSTPASTAGWNSLSCGRATWSIRCCGRPASWCPPKRVGSPSRRGSARSRPR